ncbi:MAG: hypothetical protein JNM17_22195 [Archangium sp.]|nr:hypothetical protein [Archangium sp.]
MRSYEDEARERLPAILGDLFGRIVLRESKSEAFDFLIEMGGRRLAIEVKGQLGPPALHDAFKRLSRAVSDGATPVIVVPALTAPRRAELHERGVNWLDFAGNGHIKAKALFLHVEGRELVARPGRPASVFERRGSRLTRAMLLNPQRDWSVTEAARVAALDEGQTSRLMRRLVDAGFLERDASKRFRVPDPMQLLRAWRDANDFGAHSLRRGFVPARSGLEATESVQRNLQKSGKVRRYAATGLTAAWAYDSFAAYGLTTFYVDYQLSDALMHELNVRPVDQGGNVWLVEPNDDGVFDGGREVLGLPCVHPAQVWVDLKAHPERSTEAADHLLTEAIMGFRP